VTVEIAILISELYEMFKVISRSFLTGTVNITTVSGDSRMKKVGENCGAKEKAGGTT